MQKANAEKFKILVNTPSSHEALVEYANYRIEILTKRFLSAQNWEEVRAIQHTIEELKRILSLREEVNSPTD